MKKSISTLENELATLISKDQLPFRIDSEKKHLYRKIKNDNDIAMNKVSQLTEIHASSIKSAMMKLSLMAHNFSVLKDENDIDIYKVEREREREHDNDNGNDMDGDLSYHRRERMMEDYDMD